MIWISELCGKGLVEFLVDRIGKLRALTLEFSANATTAILLPFFGWTEANLLVRLFLFSIKFENAQ